MVFKNEIYSTCEELLLIIITSKVSLPSTLFNILLIADQKEIVYYKVSYKDRSVILAT